MFQPLYRVAAEPGSMVSGTALPLSGRPLPSRRPLPFPIASKASRYTASSGTTPLQDEGAALCRCPLDRRREVARPLPAVPPTLLLAVALLVPSPAAATTAFREGLENLAADNDVIVRARVLDIHSYWNADRSFILTDVHVKGLETIKSPHDEELGDLTFSIMGGTVGETSVLLVDGPDLVAGSEYVLFLGHGNLPGARDRLTLRDLGQAVFEVTEGRALSQAFGQPLLPDAAGLTDVPGVGDGLPLPDLLRQIRDLVHR